MTEPSHVLAPSFDVQSTTAIHNQFIISSRTNRNMYTVRDLYDDREGMKHSENGLLWAQLEGEKIKQIIFV
jgi:hypothetical protein